MTAAEKALVSTVAFLIGVGLASLFVPHRFSGPTKLETPDSKAAILEAAALQRSSKYEHAKRDGYEIHEYVTPTGVPGYQVIWRDEKGTHSKGYGPEAADRTWNIPAAVATTTL